MKSKLLFILTMMFSSVFLQAQKLEDNCLHLGTTASEDNSLLSLDTLNLNNKYMENVINKGLVLLHQRDNIKQLTYDDFELLPPIMRLFFNYYNIGSYMTSSNNGYLELYQGKMRVDCHPLRVEWFEGKLIDNREYDNGVREIFEYKVIRKNIENYRNGINEIDAEGMVHIGYMEAYGEWIVLGIEDYNMDNIYVDGGNFDGRVPKIADNIFELFSMVHEYWDDEDILDYTDDKYSGKDEYRVWGNIDWKLRGMKQEFKGKRGIIISMPIKRERGINISMPIKRGLGLLKQREISSEQLESLLAILPFRASVFYKYYNTGTYEELFNFMLYQFKLSDGSEGLVIEDRWFEDEPEFNQRFGRLLTIEELNVEFEKYNDKKEEYNKKGFVLIGEMEDATKKMLMSIEGNNIEEIWIYDENGEYRKISNDIFHFFTKVNRYWSDKDIVKATNGAKTGKDLYQNWGENFWRVTE